jgi:hypothetical protein
MGTDGVQDAQSMPADATGPAPVQAPSIFYSVIQVNVAGNDVVLTLLTTKPTFRKSTGQPVGPAMRQPVAVFQTDLTRSETGPKSA